MTARWLLRFDSYRRALAVLQRATGEYQRRPLNEMEQAGVIRHYEMTWELAWKVLRDYLIHDGQDLPVITPASVLRAAFAAGLVDDGDGWMDALKLRNQLSHEYDQHRAALAVADIMRRYLALFEVLAEKLGHAKDASHHA
ncbi:MAG: nucleotidyltransferase substrate binding protein [Sphingomonadales bacterium]|nr:nucleotidyltransferase substrate binding protein [Sphingomonadales bacterium]